MERFGVIPALLFQTSLICLLSVSVTALVLDHFGVQETGVALALAFFCPAIIAPPATYSFLKVHHQMAEQKRQLQTALAEVKELKGLLPICASCKKIRDDDGYWNQIEHYITVHSNAEFTHSICPDCRVSIYGPSRSA